MHACDEEEVGGGEVQKDLTSLSVSCAICPDGLTSKLFVSSDFLPPLQLAKFTAVISRSKETGEINFSFDAMIRWAGLRCTAVAALRLHEVRPHDDLCTHVVSATMAMCVYLARGRNAFKIKKWRSEWRQRERRRFLGKKSSVNCLEFAQIVCQNRQIPWNQHQQSLLQLPMPIPGDHLTSIIPLSTCQSLKQTKLELQTKNVLGWRLSRPLLFSPIYNLESHLQLAQLLLGL